MTVTPTSFFPGFSRKRDTMDLYESVAVDALTRHSNGSRLLNTQPVVVGQSGISQVDERQLRPVIMTGASGQAAVSEWS